MMYVKIPKFRVGVLIGKNGSVKKRVEKLTGVRIKIDSNYGEITIDDRNSDAFMAMKAKEFIEAIGEGFSPERAWRIFNEDVYFEVIDIKEFTGKKENRMRVLKARIIGRNGKTRKIIEELSGANISVSSHTVAIIGDYFQLETAKHAIEMLLRGSKHATVYNYLERRRREMKYTGLEYYYIQ